MVREGSLEDTNSSSVAHGIASCNTDIASKASCSSDIPTKSTDAAETSGLEEYVSTIETKLAIKSALLDEAIRLHQSLETKVLALEEGISWKDAQLDALTRHTNEVWSIANQEFLATCRDCNIWRERAEQMELHSEILKQRFQGEIERLEEAQRQSAFQFDSEAGGQPDNGQLTRQLCESQQKVVLLEEQLRLRSGSESRDNTAKEKKVIPELGAVSFAEVWTCVGQGAADRVCGASPHFRNGPNWAAVVDRTSYINTATGGTLPPEEGSDGELDEDVDLSVMSQPTEKAASVVSVIRAASVPDVVPSDAPVASTPVNVGVVIPPDLDSRSPATSQGLIERVRSDSMVHAASSTPKTVSSATTLAPAVATRLVPAEPAQPLVQRAMTDFVSQLRQTSAVSYGEVDPKGVTIGVAAGETIRRVSWHPEATQQDHLARQRSWAGHDPGQRQFAAPQTRR